MLTFFYQQIVPTWDVLGISEVQKHSNYEYFRHTLSEWAGKKEKYKIDWEDTQLHNYHSSAIHTPQTIPQTMAGIFFLQMLVPVPQIFSKF